MDVLLVGTLSIGFCLGEVVMLFFKSEVGFMTLIGVLGECCLTGDGLVLVSVSQNLPDGLESCSFSVLLLDSKAGGLALVMRMQNRIQNTE